MINVTLLGVPKFPEHLCSMTGVDFTIFRMNIALMHPQAIDQALFLLKKIGSSASLLPKGIEKVSYTVSLKPNSRYCIFHFPWEN